MQRLPPTAYMGDNDPRVKSGSAVRASHSLQGAPVEDTLVKGYHTPVGDTLVKGVPSTMGQVEGAPVEDTPVKGEHSPVGETLVKGM